MDVSYRYTDYSPEDPRDAIRQSSAQDLTLGLRGQLSEVFSTELRLGYKRTDYENAADTIASFDDFTGFVINGNVTWALGHGSTLRLDLRREPYASNYEVFYLATGGRLLYDLDLGRFFGQLRGSYQQSDYQLEDPRYDVVRDDEQMVLGAGLGFRFSDRLALRGSYIYEDRDSNIPEFDFLNKVILVDLIFGY
jgi:hypothetical protein